MKLDKHLLELLKKFVPGPVWPDYKYSFVVKSAATEHDLNVMRMINIEIDPTCSLDCKDEDRIALRRAIQICLCNGINQALFDKGDSE